MSLSSKDRRTMGEIELNGDKHLVPLVNGRFSVLKALEEANIDLKECNYCIVRAEIDITAKTDPESVEFSEDIRILLSPEGSAPLS